jgi:hypothetical protein
MRLDIFMHNIISEDTVAKASHVSSGVYINARFRAGSRN